MLHLPVVLLLSLSVVVDKAVNVKCLMQSRLKNIGGPKQNQIEGPLKAALFRNFLNFLVYYFIPWGI